MSNDTESDQPSAETPVSAASVVEGVAQAVAPMSPWGAFLVAGANALQAFIDKYAESRKIEAAGFKAAAQELADRMNARAAKADSSVVTPPAGP